MTGWGQEADKRKAQAAGFDEHLTKPIDPTTLDATLARLLATHSHRKALERTVPEAR
jgi:CheY-like chemotaxis protein